LTLSVHASTGLLTGVRQVLSPHRDERPAGVTPDLIVMHNISLPPNEFGGPWIERLFNGHLPPEQHPYFAEIQGMRVSSHVLVRRNGEVIQFVPFHAVITALLKAYAALDSKRIVGHSDIAPGRKTDPGPAFDWTKLRDSLT